MTISIMFDPIVVIWITEIQPSMDVVMAVPLA